MELVIFRVGNIPFDNNQVVITENEALKVQILKASSLDKIEDIAKNKLKMILPTKENMIKLGEGQATEGKQQGNKLGCTFIIILRVHP